MIKSAIACNLDTHLLRAALPLLDNSEVAAIEWSFDTLYNTKNIPAWFVQLLEAFSEGQGLIGHGVFFSLFSGRWSTEQQQWLDHLKKAAQHFQFQHITEHFGFMTGANFHNGAPISVPLTKTTLAIGQDRLKRIQQACACPVGLENLAFTYALEDVMRHGDFLEKLISPINGFIILDLHNLYCQIHNFEIAFEDIIKYYPLDRVREIHISGGSWQDSALAPAHKVRRDTHDDGVPEEVFGLLQQSLKMVPNLQFVVLEQLGTGLKTGEEQERFRADFLKMKKIVDTHAMISNPATVKNFLPVDIEKLTAPIFNEQLHKQQMELSTILETAKDFNSAQYQLAKSTLANSDWHIEKWAPHMLEAVLQIAQKWKNGFD